MRAWRAKLGVVTASLALLSIGACSRGEPRTFELDGEQLTEAEFIERVHWWRCEPQVQAR